MKKKMLMWFAAPLILVIGLLISNVLSRQKEPMRRRPAASGQKSVSLVAVTNGSVHTSVEITGPLTAYDKVDLYTEVSGVLMETPKRFKAGTTYHKGDILIQIDDRVYKNNVLSQKSGLLNQITLLLPDLSIDFPESAPRWEGYLKSFELDKPLHALPDPSSDKERYYIASRNIYQQYYNIKSMEVTLSKYALYAPFDGIVAESSINPGTLVRIGQKIGEFVSSELFEMEAAVRLMDARRLRIGQSISLRTDDMPGIFNGKLMRINSVLDQQTMSVMVYVQLRDVRLRDGLYMTGFVQADPIPNVYSLRKDLLVGNDQVYTVKDSILVLENIEIIGEDGDMMIIRGLEDGSVILGDVWEDAREGGRIPDIGSPKGHPSEGQEAEGNRKK